MFSHFVLIFTLFFLVESRKVDPKDYYYPLYYWVLDREILSTIKETSINPESINSSRVTFTGKGDGHFTFPLAFTTINIGTYVIPCFNDFCKEEITIAFWFRLFDYKNHPKNGNIFEFLTFAKDLNNEVKVWFMFIDGVPEFNSEMSVSGYGRAQSKASIYFERWYYVVLTYDINDGMAVYLNTQKLKTTYVDETIPHNSHAPVNIYLGQFPFRKFKSPSFENVSISVDKILIWNKSLSIHEINNIYLTDIGMVSLLQSCRGEDSFFKIKWLTTDPNNFEQIISYKLEWLKNGLEKSYANAAIIPELGSASGRLFHIEAFEQNVLYNVSLTASTFGGLSLSSYLNNFCETEKNDSSKVHLSVTHHTALIVWEKNEKLYSFRISYRTINSSMVISNTVDINNATALNYTIVGLKPGTTYKFDIDKIDEETGVKISYKRIIETLALATLVKTPATNIMVLNVTWENITIKFFLHLQLKPFNTTYIISVRNSSSYIYKHQITLINYGWLLYGVMRLTENTLYYINFQLKDGPSLEKEIECRTKVKFPPPTYLSVLEISTDSVVISVSLPTTEIDYAIITEFKVKCISVDKTFETSYKIKNNQHLINVSIPNLDESTDYNVLVATGNGKDFGSHKSIAFQTKVKYPPPSSLRVLEISTDAALIEVALPEKDSSFVTEFKVVCVSISKTFETSYKIKDYHFTNVSIKNLDEFTEYSLFVATGDGEVFGTYKNISFQTKAQLLMSYCKSERFRGVNWPTTPSGQIVSLNCPKKSKGNVTRSCLSASWQQPNMSNCVSDNRFLKATLRSSSDVSKESMRLSTYVLSKDNMQFGSDLIVVIDAVDSLVRSSQKLTQQQISHFSETVVNITSHLLDTNSSPLWDDLSKDTQSKDAGKLLKMTDTLIETSVQLTSNLTSKVISSDNIVLNIQKLLPGENTVRSLENAVEFPEDMFAEDRETVLVVATFNRFDELIGVPDGTQLQKNGSNFTLNSKVLTVSLFPQHTSAFKNPVVIVQRFNEFPNGTTPNCVYLEDLNGSSYWSDKGCKVHMFNHTHVTCHCSHLTNFAVLMSVTNAIESLSETHVMVMDMITTFGIGISLSSLLLSFLSFIFIKSIKSIRNTIHKNLVFGLFVAELIFLFGIDSTENKVGCQIIAVLLHYFFLASFFMMAFEGIVLYLMLVQVYKLLGNSSHQTLKYICACWVLPAIVIVINLLIDYNAYGKHRNHCWLSVTNGFIWSFVGPVLLIISINILIFIKSLYIVAIKSKKRASNFAELWFWIKSSFLLICLLGITWIIGVFYINSTSLFLGYIFTIVNSLQGFLIFLFHCVLDPRVRKAWYEFFCCQSRERNAGQLLHSRNSSITISSRLSFSKKSRHGSDLKKFQKCVDEIPENSLALLTVNSKC